MFIDIIKIQYMWGKHMNVQRKMKLIKVTAITLKRLLVILFFIFVYLYIDQDAINDIQEYGIVLEVFAYIGALFTVIALILLQSSKNIGLYMIAITSIIIESFSIVINHSFAIALFTRVFLILSFLTIFLCLMHRIYKQKQKEQLQYEQQHHLFERSYDITNQLLQLTPKLLVQEDLDHLLELVLDRAFELIPSAQSGSVLIKKGDDMEFRASIGYQLDILQKVRIKFQDTYQYRLGIYSEPTVIKDVKTFNEANPNLNLSNDFKKTNTKMAKAVLTCSIMLDNEIFGFINLDNMDHEDAFTSTDRALLKHFATQTEIALKNHKLVEEIYKLSKYDALTNALSRKQYQSMITQLKEHPVDDICIIIMDINGLKVINDSYGHAVGDQYLIHFVEFLHEHIEPEDTIYRTGGDEFIVLLHDKENQTADQWVEMIKKKLIEIPFTHQDKKHTISFSSGVACYPKDSDQIEQVLRIADQKMYEEKKKSRS